VCVVRWRRRGRTCECMCKCVCVTETESVYMCDDGGEGRRKEGEDV